MQDLQPRNHYAILGHDAAAVSFFASQVVSMLAEKTTRSAPKVREPLVAGLIAASLAGTKDAFAGLLSELRMSRISLAALSDLYVPLAAARMGEDWEKDEMSWLDVSVGVSRLQSLVREIGSAWVADQATDSGYGSVLLIVPDREQHTLGPMVAMGQMRRFGVSACLRIAPTANELRSLVEARDFDGVMISVATQEQLGSVAKTVKFLKTIVTKSTPIVVGGAVMGKVADPAACTGADFSSNDIGAALEAIGLEFDAFCVLRRV